MTRLQEPVCTPIRETMSEAERCVNTLRPLTRSTSTQPKEGLAMKATRIELTGNRYGRLLVLGYIGGRSCQWECLCDCGTRKGVPGSSLRRGQAKSCGCLKSDMASQRLRLDDMTGQRFTRLCVTGFAGMRSGESFWRCICDCGGAITLRGWVLRSGRTKSCGCLHRERIRLPRVEQATYSTIHTRLAVTRGSARSHSCVDCGRGAEQWSYDHCDEGELLSDLNHPCSLDLSHYDPRCVPCHRTFDVAHGGR